MQLDIQISSKYLQGSTHLLSCEDAEEGIGMEVLLNFVSILAGI